LEVDYLTSIDYLKESMDGSTYNYEVNNEFLFPVQVNEILASKDLISELLDEESQLLEIASTIYYLKSHNHLRGKETITQKLELLKPKLKDKIPKAFELYSSLEKENKYVKTQRDLWLLKSLLGTKEVEELIRESQDAIADLDNEIIEDAFLKSDIKFYYDPFSKVLSTESSELLLSDFPKLEEASSIDILEKFGLEKMEKAKEKLVVRLDN
jgi:hypothetical protein